MQGIVLKVLILYTNSIQLGPLELIELPSQQTLLVELIESWQSIQFNIETSLIDLQPCVGS